jgi:hypothetical protein
MYFDILKYLLEALAIAFVAKYVVGKGGDLKDVLLLTVTITVALITLDKFAPDVAMFTRQGAGFGTGFKLQGGGDQEAGCGGCMVSAVGGGVEPMDDPVAMDYYDNNYVPTGNVGPDDERHAIYDTLISTHLGGAGGLQQAMGTQRTLRGQAHDSQSVQQAMGTQRTLRGQAHDSQSGGGLQQAMGTQRTLRGQAHDSQSGGSLGEGAPLSYSKGSLQVNVLDRFIDDRMAMDCRNGQTHAYMTVDWPNNAQQMQNPLYSGDIINIGTSTGEKMVLLEGSHITAVKSAPLNDRLFKLRFVKSNPSQKQIFQGQAINIAYNDDKAQTVLLNHDGGLNMLKNQKDTMFELQSANESVIQGSTLIPINKDTDVIIVAHKGKKREYLKFNQGDRRIGLTSNKEEATRFIIYGHEGTDQGWESI